MRRPSILVALGLLAGCSEYEVHTWENVDTWNQDPADEVDILMVIDDSCSMQPYQERLGENFDGFITYFIDANVDYHIGITTTDAEVAAPGSIIGQVITPETANSAELFNDTVNVGTSGSPYEMGLLVAYEALTEPRVSTANVGFLRDEASLSIILVSDEQDASPWPVNDYINAFFEVKGQRARDVFNASALTVTDESECTAEQAAASSEGTRYVDVARQTGGIVGNLCAEDFESIVTELSLNTSRLRDTFYLSEAPAADSLQVSVDDEIIACDAGVWHYDRVEDESGKEVPAIVFARESLPQPDQRIVARYDRGTGDPNGFCSGGEE